MKTVKFMQDREMELLEAAGAQKSWRMPYDDRDMSVHLLGTCRMGNDPKTQVIDIDHRHNRRAEFVYLRWIELIPSGRNQPTATIQALAYRAGDRITALAEKRDLIHHRDTEAQKVKVKPLTRERLVTRVSLSFSLCLCVAVVKCFKFSIANRRFRLRAIWRISSASLASGAMRA